MQPFRDLVLVVLFFSCQHVSVPVVASSGIPRTQYAAFNGDKNTGRHPLLGKKMIDHEPSSSRYSTAISIPRGGLVGAATSPASSSAVVLTAAAVAAASAAALTTITSTFGLTGDILATTAAAATSTVLGTSGSMMVVNPNFALDKIFRMEPIADVEEERLSKILVRNIGCASLGLATSVFLSMVMKIPVEKAVAWSLVPRFLCFGSNLSYRVRPFQVLSLLLNLFGIVALNVKTSTYMITWRFVGGRTLLEGLSLVKWPRGAVKSMFGYVDESDYQRILARSLGNEIATGAAFVGWMVLGVSAPMSLALAGVQWIICAADTAWKDKVLTTKEKPHPVPQKQMIFAAVISAASFISTMLK